MSPSSKAGLGLVYAIAYRLVGDLLVLWPLLTPTGFFANVRAGGMTLPMESVIGFGEILIGMLLLVWIVGRRQRRRALAAAHSYVSGRVGARR